MLSKFIKIFISFSRDFFERIQFLTEELESDDDLFFLSLFQEISLKECGQKGFLTQRYTKDRSKLYWYVGHNITFYLFFKRFL